MGKIKNVKRDIKKVIDIFSKYDEYMIKNYEMEKGFRC